jgi:hypothetical protein
VAREFLVEELPDLLSGSLEISGSGFEDRASGAARALGWYRHLQAFGYEAIPFFAVHDVGHLLLLGDAFPFAPSPTSIAGARWNARCVSPTRIVSSTRSVPTSACAG